MSSSAIMLHCLVEGTWVPCEEALSTVEPIWTTHKKSLKNPSQERQKVLSSFAILKTYYLKVDDEKMKKKLRSKPAKTKTDLTDPAITFFGVANARMKNDVTYFFSGAEYFASSVPSRFSEEARRLQAQWSIENKMSFSSDLTETLLLLSCIKASHLRASSKQEEISPFVECIVVDKDGEKLKGKFYTTEGDGTHPYWGHQNLAIIVPQGAHALKFSVISSNKGSKEEEGHCEILIADIPPLKNIERWFPLKSRSKSQKSTGEIKFGMFLRPAEEAKSSLSNRLLSSNTSRPARSVSMASKDINHRHGDPAGDVKIKVKYVPPLGNWSGRLRVTVFGCLDLPKRDAGSSPNPFVQIWFNDPTRAKRTMTVEKKTDPKWTEGNKFGFSVKSDDESLAVIHVQVFDNASYDEILIGETSIQLSELDRETEFINVYQLKSFQKIAPMLDGTKLATDLWIEGFRPKYPIILLPGVASSALEVVKSPNPEMVGRRVWIDINGTLSSNLQRRFGTTSTPKVERASTPREKDAKTSNGSKGKVDEATVLKTSKDSKKATRKSVDLNDTAHASGSPRQDEPEVRKRKDTKTKVSTPRHDSIEGPSASKKDKATSKLKSSKEKTSESEDVDSDSYGAVENSDSSDNDATDDRLEGEGYVLFFLKSEWLRHTVLMNDGVSDPPGIQTRPVPSFDGITHLASGLAKSLTFVFAPLVQNLEALGYVRDKTMFAFPYDWRLPIPFMEERDGLFTRMKATIEEAVKSTGQPAVILTHSLGGRVTQFFLNWIEDNYGTEWIDKHVFSLLAACTPWAGTPMTVRALLTGDDFGVSTMSKFDTGHVCRGSLSAYSIFPQPEQKYFESQKTAGVRGESFMFSRLDKGEDSSKYGRAPYVNKSGDKEYFAVPPQDFFEFANEKMMALNLKRYYEQNSLYRSQAGQLRVLQAPKVKRLINVYGTNVDSEKFAFFFKKKGRLRLDISAKVTVAGHVIKGGIGFETSETVQHCLKAAGASDCHRSGDGTVCYESLSYPNFNGWSNTIPNFEISEISGAGHRFLLSTQAYLRIVVSHVCQKRQ